MNSLYNDVAMPAESMNILVVDDEHLLCWTLKQVFDELGYVTTCCSTALDAIRALREPKYALLITDFRLPDGSGFEVAAFAKDFSHVGAVILLTAETERRHMASPSAYVNEVIEKPFDIDALVQSAQKYLQPEMADSDIQ